MTVTDNQPVSVGNLKAVLSSLGGGFPSGGRAVEKH